ncbi:hypothetical protein [Streptomyces achromogenes]|uniref:hypothetical protein n=1 Tax=Streptomyces achromogenes TaxID=67255 RepID=UPI0033C8341F
MKDAERHNSPGQQRARWNHRRSAPLTGQLHDGVHKLYNEYGQHRIFNNQTGSATSQLCINSDGTNCTGKTHPYAYFDYDLTPYNSIRLNPS